MRIKGSKYLFLALAGSFALNTSAQNQLTHYVVGSAGGHAQGSNITLNSTVGEVAISTATGLGTITTEGFHQPRYTPVVPGLFVSGTNASCPDQSDGSVMIDSIVGCTGPFQILWSTGDTTLTVFGLPAGLYTVNVTSSDCDLDMDIEIFNETDGPCQLTIFNGITPNGDGHNDQWIIQNIELFGPNTANIFNRWGQLVWNVDDYNNTDRVWKGQDNDHRDLPDGTYFYVLELSTKTYKGYVELTR